jgi:hypothetical protein
MRLDPGGLKTRVAGHLSFSRKRTCTKGWLYKATIVITSNNPKAVAALQERH